MDQGSTANGVDGTVWQMGRDTDPASRWRCRVSSMKSKDLAEDPHLNERGFFTRLPHPEVGVQTHIGIPCRLSNGPNGVRKLAPLLDEDADAVMRDILHCSDEEIATLKEQKVLY